MKPVKVVPSVVVQKVLNGGSIAGVDPVGSTLVLTFIGASAPFDIGEAITWGASNGILEDIFYRGPDNGFMIITVAAGPDPVHLDTITGVVSGATCDVFGPVEGYVHSGERFLRGQYLEYGWLTNGGLFYFPDAALRGFRVTEVLLSAPGVTAINMFVRDLRGDDIFAGSVPVVAGNAYNSFRSFGLLVPPGCKFVVSCTGVLTADGSLMVSLGRGMPDTAFSDNLDLGISNVRPG